MEQHRTACADGSMNTCDQLWAITPVGSDLEAYALTCGGRDPAGAHPGTCEEDLGSAGRPTTTNGQGGAVRERSHPPTAEGAGSFLEPLLANRLTINQREAGFGR